MAKRLVSFIIGFLNEEENLRTACDEIRRFETIVPDSEIEIILVDDGSTDGSWRLAQDLVRSDPRIRAIRLTRNFGSHAAVMAGISAARGEFLCDYAADGQDPIEIFADLLRLNDAKRAKVAWGIRRNRNDSLFSRIFSRVYSLLMRRFALPGFPPEGLDTFCVHADVAAYLRRHFDGISSLHGLIFWAGFPTASMPFDRRPRARGRSRWSLGRKVELLVNSFVAFSYAPLRFVTLMGLAFALVGVGWGAHVGYYAAVHGFPIAGWASIMIVLLIGFGCTNLALGIISEYIFRILEVSRGRPAWVVGEEIGSSGASRS